MGTNNPSFDNDGDDAKHQDDLGRESLQNEIIDLISKIPKDKVMLLDKIIIELVKSRGGGYNNMTSYYFATNNIALPNYKPFRIQDQFSSKFEYCKRKLITKRYMPHQVISKISCLHQ